jgi:hypothetical protein
MPISHGEITTMSKMDRYSSLKAILVNFIQKEQTLSIVTPRIRNDSPHKQVVCLGTIFKTPITFTMLRYLWGITKHRLIVTFLEGEINQIVTAKSNENLYIYRRDLISEIIKELPGKKSVFSVYLDIMYDDLYLERLCVIERVDKHEHTRS